MRLPRFQVYRSGEDRQWRWRLIGGNGETVMSGEGHPDCRGARRAVARVRRLSLLAGATQILDRE